MVQLMCYGEDGLTLAAVTEHLDMTLKILGDTTKSKNCLVLYRPSFGRNGGNNGASFGEFDAILATKRRVYLIESKWIRSGIKDGKIKLKQNQFLRHEIFEWIWKRWKNQPSWEEFRTKYHTTFEKAFNNKPLASKNRILAKNLEQVLKLLFNNERRIEHIVLAFYQYPKHQPKGVDQSSVEYNSIKFKLINFSNIGINIEEVFKLNTKDSTGTS